MPVNNANWMTGSSCSPHARLLENRLAYQVLEAVYQLIPAGTRGGPALDDPLNIPIELYDYQNWIHARLPASGLAKGIAAGPDFLPDISVELPHFWRLVYRLTAPCNYRQLSEQVVRNLAWYLGEGTPPITLAHKLRSSLFPTVIMTIFLMIPLLFTTGLGEQPWPVILLCGLVFMSLILWTMWCYGTATTGRFRANCAELYAYLLEAYSEPGEESENKVQSLLKEMGRDTDNSNNALVRRARKRSGTWTLR